MSHQSVEFTGAPLRVAAAAAAIENMVSPLVISLSDSLLAQRAFHIHAHQSGLLNFLCDKHNLRYSFEPSRVGDNIRIRVMGPKQQIGALLFELGNHFSDFQAQHSTVDVPPSIKYLFFKGKPGTSCNTCSGALHYFLYKSVQTLIYGDR